jgi:hypothetical protein
VFEYLPPQRGQSIAIQGRFVYLHGPSDTTRPMRAYGGTYTVSGDTITNTVLYDTDPKGVGRRFRWMVTATSGDTVEFGILNAAGQVTSRGRSVLRR